MARNADPFTPRGPLDKDTLERYAQGLLTPEECHEVELHLERDPLLRDALEGLMAPGALEAVHDLRRHSPAGGKGNWLVGILAGAVATGGILLFIQQTDHGPLPPAAPAVIEGPSRPIPMASAVPAAVESTLLVVDRELEALADQPTVPDEQTGPEENFRQRSAEVAAVARESVDRIGMQRAAIGQEPGRPDAMKPERSARPSRQLVFLHGLKLVHPSELAGPARSVQGSPGQSADAGQARRDRLPDEPLARPYLDLMDEAMGTFANGAYRAALDELYFMLSQNPEDVNAQFYAGLACYHLGLYPRAAQLLRAAADNPVDSFNEEAEWYGALTVERREGPEAARPVLERIIREGGFYAEQALGRLGR